MAGSQKVSGEIVEQVVFEMLGKGKKPAKLDEEERIYFSLTGCAIELTQVKEVPNDSVFNTFYLSCGDVEDLIVRSEDTMDKDERSGYLGEVRKTVEELLALIEHAEWSATDDEGSADLKKRRERLFAQHGISMP